MAHRFGDEEADAPYPISRFRTPWRDLPNISVRTGNLAISGRDLFLRRNAKVAISDMLEIQSSQLALDRQPDADTKPFAERMITDHQQTSKELKALVESGKVKASLPTGLDAEHQKKLDELKAKSGKEFDRAYDEMQQQAHEEAVALFSDYARNGDNPDVKAWAAKTLPHLREHLEMAKKLS